jgi:hypothetical protein
MEEPMKKQLTLVSVLLLSLVIAFLIMSCASPTQNSNQTANANANASTANKPDELEECSFNGITNSMNKIFKDTGIENQHTGNGNQYGTKNIVFKPVQMGTEWVLLIEGGISDGKKDKPNENAEHMEKFIKAVDQIITKTCITRAMFVQRGTIERLEKGTLGLGDVPGFDWSTCDWPNIACPDGRCLERCPDKSGPSGTPSNSNAGNANSGGNANANGTPSTNRTP